MSTHKHIDLICVLATAAAILVMLLFMHGEALGITVMADSEDTDLFTKNDLLADWDTSDAAVIRLNGDGGTVTGTGAYISDGDVHIAFAGKYIISGELTDGSVIIDADGDDKIWILLDGVSLHCEDDAALLIRQAKKVFLTLATGKINTISGGASMSADAKSKTDGILYSRDDLTINGRGSLYVQSEYQHGIVCNDSLIITDGDIHITAIQDGIHAHDGVKIANANLEIQAGDDGITVENDDQTDSLYIASGSVTITGCYEGLEASSVLITGGSIDITPADDGINAQKSIEIAGGDIRIINETGRDADGLDSNGDIVISGGSLFISVSTDGGSCAIDYGSEQGGTCRIDGGTVIACGSTVLAEEISPASAQNFIMHRASGSAGSLLSLQDQQGNTVLSETIPCAFSLVTLSDPSLIKGDAYSLLVGDQSEEITVDNSSEVSGFGGFGGGPGRDFGGGFDGFGKDFGGDFKNDFSGRPEEGSGGLDGRPNEAPGGFDGKSDEDSGGAPNGSDKGRGKFKGAKPDMGGQKPAGDSFMPGGSDAVPAMGQMPPGDMPFDPGTRPGRDDPQRPLTFDRNPGINSRTFILIGASAALLILALFIAYKKNDTHS